MSKSTVFVLRVSTDRQDTENQKKELMLSFSQTLNGEWFESICSGKSRKRQQEIDDLMTRIRSRQIEKIVCVDFSRICRKASLGLELLETCKQWGVDIESKRHGYNLQSPSGQLMAGIMAVLAEHEVNELSARTRAGMAVAKSLGKVIGGKVGKDWVTKRIAGLWHLVWRDYDAGDSINAISKARGISWDKVRWIISKGRECPPTYKEVLRTVPFQQRGKAYQEAHR